MGDIVKIYTINFDYAAFFLKNLKPRFKMYRYRKVPLPKRAYAVLTPFRLLLALALAQGARIIIKRYIL
jgi:hypothetical protein